MRALFASLILVLGGTLTLSGLDAQEKKEVTLKGKITCAKCDLNQTDACATVIVIKKDKKDVVFFFDAAADKKHHAAICSDSKNGSVTGVTGKKGDKMTITVKELKFD